MISVVLVPKISISVKCSFADNLKMSPILCDQPYCVINLISWCDRVSVQTATIVTHIVLIPSMTAVVQSKTTVVQFKITVVYHNM